MANDNQRQLNRVLSRHGYRQVFAIKNDEHSRFNGIISDRKGKRYFIKAVIGKNSYEYKSLQRESQVTQYLSQLTKRINITNNTYRLHVPIVAKVIDQDGVLCLITWLIDGKNLLKENSYTQTAILSTTLELVAKLSNKTRLSTIRPYLKNYTRKSLFLSIPFRFAKAAILSPFVVKGLIKASLKASPLLFINNKDNGLVHADINVSNIILHKKNIYLTDWEEAGWGISVYNTITPLCVHWQDKKLRDILLRKLVENGQKRMIIPLLAYRTLMLFNQHIARKNKKRKRDLMLLKFLDKAQTSIL